MAVEEIHVGDIGTVFRLTMYDGTEIVNVSTATDNMKIHFLKPDGNTVTNDASFYTDGTDGIIQYMTSTVDELDQSGPWKIQAKVTLPGAGTWSSNIESFRVYSNITL